MRGAVLPIPHCPFTLSEVEAHARRYAIGAIPVAFDFAQAERRVALGPIDVQLECQIFLPCKGRNDVNVDSA